MGVQPLEHGEEEEVQAPGKDEEASSAKELDLLGALGSEPPEVKAIEALAPGKGKEKAMVGGGGGEVAGDGVWWRGEEALAQVQLLPA